MRQELLLAVRRHDLPLAGDRYRGLIRQIEISTTCLLQNNNWVRNSVPNQPRRQPARDGRVYCVSLFYRACKAPNGNAWVLDYRPKPAERPAENVCNSPCGTCNALHQARRVRNRCENADCANGLRRLVGFVDTARIATNGSGVLDRLTQDLGTKHRIDDACSVHRRDEQTQRVNGRDRVASPISVGADAAGEPDRIALNVSTGDRVVIAEVVVNRSARRRSS